MEEEVRGGGEERIRIKMIQIKVIKMMDSHQVQVWVSEWGCSS